MAQEFRMQPLSGVTDASYISNIVVQASPAPTNGQAIVYSTTAPAGWKFSDVVATTGDQTIAGNKTFSGTTRLGTNGTGINQFLFGQSTAFGTGTAVDGSASTNVVFANPFATTPTITASVVSAVGDEGVVVVIHSVTNSGCTFEITNKGGAALAANVTIHYHAVA